MHAAFRLVCKVSVIFSTNVTGVFLGKIQGNNHCEGTPQSTSMLRDLYEKKFQQTSKFMAGSDSSNSSYTVSGFSEERYHEKIF
jgi:hypothetical protein